MQEKSLKSTKPLKPRENKLSASNKSVVKVLDKWEPSKVNLAGTHDAVLGQIS